MSSHTATSSSQLAAHISSPTLLVGSIGLLLLFSYAGYPVEGAAKVFLGNGIYMPTTNLGDDLNPRGAIFEGNMSNFVHELPFPNVKTSKSFQESAEAVFKEFGATYEVSAPIKVLELSFEASFKRIAGSLSSVTAAYVRVESYSKRAFLGAQARYSQIPLSTAFLNDFRALPEPPSSTAHMDPAWASYRSFFIKWGTHFVSNIFYGTWLNQWTVAAKDKRYSGREMEARACATLTGTSSSSIPSIGACAGFTASELSAAMKLTARETKEVRGGEPDLVSRLTTQPTEKLVQEFIEQGRTGNDTVRYSFVPVWKPLLAHFSSPASSEFRRAMALEAYYTGYLAYKCTHHEVTSTSPATILRKFRKKGNTASYQCVRGCIGCRNNGDCHYNAVPAGCWCWGNSCIAKDNDDRAYVQTRKDNLGRGEGPNEFCYHNAIPAECRCHTGRKEAGCDYKDNTIPVWDQDSLH